MSEPLSCPNCGSIQVAVARDMLATRHCGYCGHKWLPKDDKEPPVHPAADPLLNKTKLELIQEIADNRALFVHWKEMALQLERQIPRLEATNALYYKTMSRLSKRNEELEAAVVSLANEVQALRGSNG